MIYLFSGQTYTAVFDLIMGGCDSAAIVKTHLEWQSVQVSCKPRCRIVAAPLPGESCIALLMWPGATFYYWDSSEE
jgi:hypothetical protein